MTPAEQELFRHIERTVLDQQYRRCRLLQRCQHVAIRALLDRYAQVLRDLRTGAVKQPSDRARSQIANDGLRALAHCFRWIRAGCPKSIELLQPSNQVLADEAIEMLRWGVAYDPLYNQHIAFSRKTVDASISEASRTIVFLPRTTVDPHFFCAQVRAKELDDTRLAQRYPDDQLAALSKLWFDSVCISGNTLEFDPATIRGSAALEVVISWLENMCVPELDPDVSLGGYSVGALRRVLAAVHVLSLFIVKCEDVADDQHGDIARLPNCILTRSETDLHKCISLIANVPQEQTAAILNTLTFRDERGHVTVAHKPIISNLSGTLHFVPRLNLLLNLPQTFFRALTLSAEGQAIYSHVINAIESAGVATIAHSMRDGLLANCDILEQRNYRLASGRTITPDIVVLAADRRELLVIDIKYSAPPFGPGDVLHDVHDMTEWKAAVERYVAAFTEQPSIIGQHFQVEGSFPPTVHGLVLLRWPFPIPVDFPRTVSAVDWPSLQHYLQQASQGTIDSIVRWVRKRPDAGVPTNLVWHEKSQEVMDWTYRYSVLTAAAG